MLEDIASSLRYFASPKEDIKNIKDEFNQSDEKLKEIELFIGNERYNLHSLKTQCKTDYIMLTKLLKDLENNRRAWRDTINRNTGDRTRRMAVGSVKDKLAYQSQLLSNQVDQSK